MSKWDIQHRLREWADKYKGKFDMGPLASFVWCLRLVVVGGCCPSLLTILIWKIVFGIPNKKSGCWTPYFFCKGSDDCWSFYFQCCWKDWKNDLPKTYSSIFTFVGLCFFFNPMFLGERPLISGWVWLSIPASKNWWFGDQCLAFDATVGIPAGKQFATLKMAIAIVDLPINSMVLFNSYVNVYQRVSNFQTNSKYIVGVMVRGIGGQVSHVNVSHVSDVSDSTFMGYRIVTPLLHHTKWDPLDS